MSLQDIITAIRKLLGIEPTVESITKPFTKISTKLDKHSARQNAACATHAAAAAKLTAKADQEAADAVRAAEAAKKFANLSF